MKMPVLFLLLSGLCTAAAAQQNYMLTKEGLVDQNGKPVTGISLPKTGLQDTMIQKLKDYLQKRKTPENGMPNAITVMPLPDMYVGNNGKGQDIYRAQQDNMPVLKPDSSFYSFMPGARTYEQPKPPSTPGLRYQTPQVVPMPGQPKYRAPKRS